MQKNYDYEVQFGLQHHEVPAKIDLNTGEVKQIKKKPKLPEGKRLSMRDNFAKVETRLLPYFNHVFNNNEISIIYKMIQMSEFETNALKPLNNDTTIKELSDTFNIGKNQVKKYFDHLFKMGVYAQFKIYKDNKKEYWILNPHIAFKGKTGDESIYKQFDGTQIQKYLQNLD
jgi:hypothetical protein